jgi:hypothetical protein
MVLFFYVTYRLIAKSDQTALKFSSKSKTFSCQRRAFGDRSGFKRMVREQLETLSEDNMSDSELITAIKIDPYSSMVSQIQIRPDLQSMYEQMRCKLITAVYLDDVNCMYLDDEGLLVDPASQAYFSLQGFDQPFAGIGLIVGTDVRGNSANTTENLFRISERVHFHGTPIRREETEDGELWSFV